MPDLETEAVTAWFTRIGPPANDWPNVVRPVENEDGVALRLVHLGTALDAAAERDLAALSAALRSAALTGDLTAILAQLGAARTLRLLSWCSEQDLPECRAITETLTGQAAPAGQAVAAAASAALRRAVLASVFAPARLAALELAVSSPHQEAA